MRPTHHAIISVGVSVLFASWVKSWQAVLACFLSGIFIDVDHVLDFILSRKKIPWTYSELEDFCGRIKQGKLHLIFHSYEFWLLFWFAAYQYSFNIVWIGIGVGVCTHIICDQFLNPLRPLAYFFTYRYKHEFNKEYVFKEKYFQKMV